MLAEAVSPASAALPELAHLHLLAHLAGVPTEASLSYNNVGGAMKVAGALTGQPQLAAAGATLQKSGEIAVVGGRTAVAAGRAQKKLVKGKNQAALQKLGHAGRNAMAITTLAR